MTSFLPATLIASQRDGQPLTGEEIRFLIDGYVRGRIPDCQMAAWAMAVCLRGMDDRETADLTDAMIASGTRLRRVGPAVRVDKHSTGGLGDKVSLILAPLLACCGLHVPMISGRALGITGGTLDKIEAIPGFRTDLSEAEIEARLADAGCVITGATETLVPADRKLYALRDVTATVASIPLITASIMSKKVAESLDALVLDVKFGSGTFMPTLARARELAAALVATGRRLGVETRALLTDMNQPLGCMVGNAGEVNEAVAVLENRGPADVRELTLRLGATLLVAARLDPTETAARTRLTSLLDDGTAAERWQRLVHGQGGRLDSPLPLAPGHEFISPAEGWLQEWNGQLLGQAVIQLRGGRQHAGDTIDHGVGLEMLARPGDRIARRQPLARVFARDQDHEKALPLLRSALLVGEAPPPPVPLTQPFDAP